MFNMFKRKNCVQAKPDRNSTENCLLNHSKNNQKLQTLQIVSDVGFSALIIQNRDTKSGRHFRKLSQTQNFIFCKSCLWWERMESGRIIRRGHRRKKGKSVAH